MYNENLHFHFTGIGGSGMSGIAEILVNSGYTVSGSDLVLGASCERLQSLGVRVEKGHSPDFVPKGASLVVYSSAVSLENPELVEARRRNIPVVKRAEVLAELMRLKYGVAIAGAHGKTTTTSILGWILEGAGLDPTVVIGGQVKQRGSGGRSGNGEFLVAEADESDRSFLLLKPTVALVTNIDREHMSAYGSEEDLKDAFRQFLDSVPFYGLAALCIDDPYLRTIAANFQRRCTTYGFSHDADIRGVVHGLSENGVTLEIFQKEESLFTVEMPLLGRHLAQNTVGAVAVAIEFGIAPEAICEALKSYPGVERRLEKLGVVNGITIYNDYGHHPVEIRATLRALRESFASSNPRIVVLFQPHRYSRTKESYAEFLDCFEDCDELFVTNIHPAGEKPIAGISAETLASEIHHDRVRYIGALPEGLEQLCGHLHTGDLLVLLGAGSVGKYGGEVQALLNEGGQRAA